MLEIRFHGRGGQGAVTSVELFAISAIAEGKYAQGFPSFGPERRGAPVVAFLRISDKPVKIRSKIYNPDVVVILDPSLVDVANPTFGLKKGGIIVLNTAKSHSDLGGAFKGYKVAIVDAYKIAMEEMGVNIVNTTMLGSLIKATDVIRLKSIEEPVRERFGRLAEKNISALKRAYKETIIKEL
ncbi:MAG: 2-oxoacid:acceptor oxidoreductase family protein [Deltaproteobacteria bacterium]|nr:2-oxoacid:acceptor oxidoreductase family protein [Deltaproteobacteria bacterium]